MHGKWNTIINFFKKSRTRLYQFLECGGLNLIGMASWMCQECTRIILLLWNVLYVGKQFSEFCEKMQVFLVFLGAAFLSLALGLQCAHICQWIRVKRSSPKPCFNAFQYLIFKHLFQSFSYLSHANHWRFFPFEGCTKYWGLNERICCTKGFGKHDLLFLSYLILIKWINNNNNSNN